MIVFCPNSRALRQEGYVYRKEVTIRALRQEGYVYRKEVTIRISGYVVIPVRRSVL